MNSKSLIVGLAVGVVTTWAAGKVVKTLGLPGYATPIVVLVVGPFVQKASRTSSSGARAERPGRH